MHETHTAAVGEVADRGGTANGAQMVNKHHDLKVVHQVKYLQWMCHVYKNIHVCMQTFR